MALAYLQRSTVVPIGYLPACIIRVHPSHLPLPFTTHQTSPKPLTWAQSICIWCATPPPALLNQHKRAGHRAEVPASARPDGQTALLRATQPISSPAPKSPTGAKTQVPGFPHARTHPRTGRWHRHPSPSTTLPAAATKTQPKKHPTTLLCLAPKALPRYPTCLPPSLPHPETTDHPKNTRNHSARLAVPQTSPAHTPTPNRAARALGGKLGTKGHGNPGRGLVVVGEPPKRGRHRSSQDRGWSGERQGIVAARLNRHRKMGIIEMVLELGTEGDVAFADLFG